MNFDFSQDKKDKGLFKAFAYCQKRRLLNDSLGRSVTEAYENGICTDLDIAVIMGRKNHHQRLVESGQIAPFESQKSFSGNIVLGYGWDYPHRELRMPVKYITGNTLCVSNAGGGKTNRIHFIAPQIAAAGISTWLIDLRKNEFEKLQEVYANMGLTLTCISAADMKVNPLQTPLNVDPKIWATYCSELLVQVLVLPPRTAKITAVIIHRLYEEFGVFNGSNTYPTLWDLYNAFVDAVDINAQSRSAMLDTLKPLLQSIGSIINYNYGWLSHELTRHNLVINLGAICEKGKDLILNTLILGEFSSRIAANVSGSCNPIWVAVDEANRICGADNSGLFGLADLITVVRSSKINLDLSAQNANLHPQILANTASKVIGRTSNYSDLNLIGRSIGVSHEQSRFLLHNLNPGDFLMQLGQGSSRKPFLVKVPLVDFAASAYKKICLPPQSNPLENLKVISAKSGRPKITVSADSSESVPTKLLINRSDFASDVHAKVMKIIADNPMLTLAELISKSGMSSKTLLTIRGDLVAKKYIAERKISRSGPGRSSLRFEPLKSGIDALNNHFEGGN